jgi:hypothetical protein
VEQKEMQKQLVSIYAEFQNPGAEYRAKPFWAWNDQLEESEIRRQINVFAEMGFGGYFMHSRVGLKTSYLGDEWFRMIEAGIDEGRKNGMEAWLYDEDRWPSGLAGGLVTSDPRWRQRRLNCVRVKAGGLPDKALAVFRASFDRNGNVSEYTHILPEQVRADEEVLAFEVVQGKIDSFYNGYTYLDTLNKEAIRAFLDVTYEPYAERFGGEFGRTIPGVFTDEPNRGHFMGRWKPDDDDFQIPWTGRLPEHFAAQFGYDLLERLPEVFYNLSGSESRFSEIRAHVAECINRLFVAAFAEQVGQWCENHGLILTGHILSENTLGAQLSCAGSMARFYEHMQAPGMDILRHLVHYIVPKQVQSVARQFGKKRTLSEIYANHGWHAGSRVRVGGDAVSTFACAADAEFASFDDADPVHVCA